MRKNNLDLFNRLRKEYPCFVFRSFETIENNDGIDINYYYSLNNEIDFCNKVVVHKKDFKFKFDIMDKSIQNIIFNIGIVEAISYYKLTCSPIFRIECGNLDSYQKKWWQKLIYNGLGELRYLNSFEHISLDEFVQFETLENDVSSNICLPDDITSNFEGNLIPIGGGKDSIVTLELLNKYDNVPFMFYHKRKASYDTCHIYGKTDNEIFEVDRFLDTKLFELNSQGYINGHVPISSMIAFVTILASSLLGKKYIVLSNESSSNEGNIEGTNINHQYSKSYEFEYDFNEYVAKYFTQNIKYFSLLRPISEYQIAKQLVKHEKYLNDFRSCNAGIKTNVWCCNCSKCMFVYCLTLPLLDLEKTNNIFGSSILDNINLELDFRKLIGLECEKPFECVGTKDEIIFGLKKYISSHDTLPTLLEKYKQYILDFNVDNDYDMYFNNEHFVPNEYLEILKKEILG